MITIPVFDLPVFRYRKTLGGTRYTLRFRWNTQDLAWRLDIFNESGDTLIVGGIRVVYGSDLLAPYQHLVPGTMRVTEPSRGVSNGDRPLREDFATGVAITYDETFQGISGGELQEKADQLL